MKNLSVKNKLRSIFILSFLFILTGSAGGETIARVMKANGEVLVKGL